MSSMRYYLLLMAGNILVKYIICTSLNPEGKKKKKHKKLSMLCEMLSLFIYR